MQPRGRWVDLARNLQQQSVKGFRLGPGSSLLGCGGLLRECGTAAARRDGAPIKQPGICEAGPARTCFATAGLLDRGPVSLCNCRAAENQGGHWAFGHCPGMVEFGPKPAHPYSLVSGVGVCELMAGELLSLTVTPKLPDLVGAIPDQTRIPQGGGEPSFSYDNTPGHRRRRGNWCLRGVRGYQGPDSPIALQHE
jgi:hypothetical protein